MDKSVVLKGMMGLFFCSGLVGKVGRSRVSRERRIFFIVRK